MYYKKLGEQLTEVESMCDCFEIKQYIQVSIDCLFGEESTCTCCLS